MKPLPQEWIALHEHEVEVYRRVFCEHYGQCVSEAAQKRWEGFTCIFCPLAELAPLTLEGCDLSREVGLSWWGKIHRENKKGVPR